MSWSKFGFSCLPFISTNTEAALPVLFAQGRCLNHGTVDALGQIIFVVGPPFAL